MVEIAAALATAFGREADEPLYLAFEMGLDGLTAAQIKSAASKALRTCKFMPTPAELRELAGELTVKQRAVIAWESVSKASSGGYYATVEFDDPVINAAIRNIGGWEYLTTFEDTAEFESFVRKRFEAAYEALYKHGISAEQAGPLLGYHDRTNTGSGYKAQPVLRIETGLPKPAVRIGGPAPIGQRALPAPSTGPKAIGEVLEGLLE